MKICRIGSHVRLLKKKIIIKTRRRKKGKKKKSLTTLSLIHPKKTSINDYINGIRSNDLSPLDLMRI